MHSEHAKSASSGSTVRRPRLGSWRWLSANALEALGALLLLLVGGFAIVAWSRDGLLRESRYLMAGDTAGFPVPNHEAFVSPLEVVPPTPTAVAGAPTRQGAAIDVEAPPLRSAGTVTGLVAADPGVEVPDPIAGLALDAAFPADSFAQPTAAAPPAVVTPTAGLAITPTAVPQGLFPVHIRIPAIGVDRGVIEVPRVRDPRTGTWTRDLNLLFRPGRKDLVGHWGGSALLGEQGNMILVGHNYGYGYTGVFLRLGRLRAGDEVSVLDAAGGKHTYRVKTVTRVPWRKKDKAELLQHTSFLAIGGPERLTLVTCGGSQSAPFPERIYVVAEPVR
jgi:hypothetical protein